MKKLLLFLFTLLFFGAMFVKEVSAQTSPEFGIRGGVNFGLFYHSKQEVDSPRVGLLTGAYGTFKMPYIPLFIQPEVLYSQKGAIINGVKVKLNYLEIPVLFRINLASKGSLAPHLYAGPYVGFKLHYEEEPPPSAHGIEENNTDYGLVFGAGFDIKKINVGVRYNLGLNEIFDIEEERHHVIGIVVGIKL